MELITAIEALFVTMKTLNEIKKFISESNSKKECRKLKEKQRELEEKINRLERKIVKLEKKMGGREVSLQLFYCQKCGNLLNIKKRGSPVIDIEKLRSNPFSLPWSECSKCGCAIRKIRFLNLH